MGRGSLSPPLPSPLLSKWRTRNIGLLQGFAATKIPALQANQVDFGICDIVFHPLINYSLFESNQDFFLERFRPNQICNFATNFEEAQRQFFWLQTFRSLRLFSVRRCPKCDFIDDVDNRKNGATCQAKEEGGPLANSTLPL